MVYRRLPALFSITYFLVYFAFQAPLLGQQSADDGASKGNKPRPTTPGLSERTGVNEILNRAPTAKDVILGVDQFNIFQTSAQETALSRGDDALKAFSAAQVKAAEERVKLVDAAVKSAGLNIVFPGTAQPVSAGRTGALAGATGTAYVKAYYSAQKAEFETVVSLLKRYMLKADNEVVKAFAGSILPAFEKGLAEVELASSKT